MTKYDVIIVLGSQPDPETWKFPEQIYHCLDKTGELFEEGIASFVITSGKWGIAIENQGLVQPFKECDVLAEYLVNKGVPQNKILREGESKDTISNLYFIKTKILIPNGLNKLLFVVADFRIPRLKFLCERILGSEYTIDFEPINSEVGSTYNEPQTLDIQSKFLKPMRSGDHAWLADKFYEAPIYQKGAKHD